MRFGITVGCALIFGSMYFGLGTEYGTQTDVLNIMGCLYAMNILIGLLNGFSVQEVVAKERVVYFRERSANAYDPLPAALALVAVEIPYLMVQAVLYVSIGYWMVGFAASAGKFFFFLLVTFLNLTLCTTFGMLLVNCSPSVSVSPPLPTPLPLTTGRGSCTHTERQRGGQRDRESDRESSGGSSSHTRSFTVFQGEGNRRITSESPHNRVLRIYYTFTFILCIHPRSSGLLLSWSLAVAAASFSAPQRSLCSVKGSGSSREYHLG